jgi:hypothetical protein
MIHLLSHLLGLDNLSGPWYGFWSGFGSDIGELAIVGGLLAMVRRHNCHMHGCWRIGRHPTTVNGVQFVVCRRHHPQAPDRLTAEHIADAASNEAGAP